MAALVEGVEYGLSSLGSTSSNKSVLHVKLTDSALKAIEEYISFKENRVPKITFHDTQGVICIPNKAHANGERNFKFSLSNVHGDPKGSFDCVQQNAARSKLSLELLGSMTKKATVHATEDSYQTTRERMAIAEEESKSKSAKEIKRGGPHMGRRVKVVKKHESSAPPVPSSRHFSPIDPRPALHDTSRDSGGGTGGSGGGGGGGGGAPHRDSHSSSSNGSKSGTTPSSIVNNHSAHANHVNNSSSSQHRPSPQPDSMRVSNSSRHSHQRMSPNITSHHNASKPAHPDVLKKPLRERIIHLLALKPYKKPEMILRLSREGVKDKDKSQISEVLRQGGQFSTKDNAYSLAKHCYSQVKLDWPDYKEEDIARIKKRLALENRSSTPPNVSPAVSPVHSIGSQGSPTNSSVSQKRTSDLSENVGPQMKKQRVARTSKPAVPSPRPSSPSVQPPAKHNSDTPVKSSLNSSSRNQIQEIENCQENNNNFGDKNGKTDLDDIENQDFMKQYGRIDTLEQRNRYKKAFNHEYEEYRTLHGEIEKSTLIFQKLRDQLYQESEGSEAYENIKDQIFQEYKALKKDPQYSITKKRCEYLHKKLGHIKKLIHDYDTRHHIQS